MGTAATFSFFPSKNLGCFGDGGAITTSDAGIAERDRVLRFHGSRDKVSYEHVGYNSRLDELQAAVLRVQLPHLTEWASGRRRAAAHYEQAGLGELVALPSPTLGASPAWHLYVVSSPSPPALEAALSAASVGHKAYYRTPIHRQAAMRAWGAGVDLPATDHAAATHLAIPLSPVLTVAQASEVVAAARDAPPDGRRGHKSFGGGPGGAAAWAGWRRAVLDRPWIKLADIMASNTLCFDVCVPP